MPVTPVGGFVDPSEAAGFRMMAKHGALPEEISLRKQHDAAKVACASADGADKKTAMARLAEAEMKLSMAMEARRRFRR